MKLVRASIVTAAGLAAMISIMEIPQPVKAHR